MDTHPFKVLPKLHSMSLVDLPLGWVRPEQVGINEKQAQREEWHVVGNCSSTGILLDSCKDMRRDRREVMEYRPGAIQKLIWEWG